MGVAKIRGLTFPAGTRFDKGAPPTGTPRDVGDIHYPDPTNKLGDFPAHLRTTAEDMDKQLKVLADAVEAERRQVQKNHDDIVWLKTHIQTGDVWVSSGARPGATATFTFNPAFDKPPIVLVMCTKGDHPHSALPWPMIPVVFAVSATGFRLSWYEAGVQGRTSRISGQPIGYAATSASQPATNMQGVSMTWIAIHPDM